MDTSLWGLLILAVVGLALIFYGVFKPVHRKSTTVFKRSKIMLSERVEKFTIHLEWDPTGWKQEDLAKLDR